MIIYIHIYDVNETESEREYHAMLKNKIQWRKQCYREEGKQISHCILSINLVCLLFSKF